MTKKKTEKSVISVTQVVARLVVSLPAYGSLKKKRTIISVITDKEKREKLKGKIKAFNEKNNIFIFSSILNTLTEFEKKEEGKKIVEEKKKKKEIGEKKAKNFKIYESLKHILIEKNGDLFLGDVDIDVPIPQLLALKLKKAVEEKKDVERLLNFWRWCLLNPDENSRNALFKYIENNKSMIITPEGFVLSYRRVQSVKYDRSKLEDFKKLNFLYYRCLTENKNPDEYLFAKSEEENPVLVPSIVKEGFSNKLQKELHFVYGDEPIMKIREKLKKNIEDFQFTDNYTKTFKIKLQEWVKIDRSLCDPNPNNDCSNGLHLGTAEYIASAHSGFNGDVCIITVFNPMDAVSVPKNEGYKMRVCAYLPIDIVDEKSIENLLQSDMEEIDYVTSASNIENLRNLLKDKQLKISSGGKTIVIKEEEAKKLLDISEVITKRIIKI